MKKKIYFLTILLLVVLMVMPAQSQLKKTAQTGLQFLKIDMSPRAAAMGASFNQISGDASSIFYNPSGIADFEGTLDVFATQTQWIADINYNAFAGIYSFERWGTFGLHGIFADYGDIEETVIDATSDKGYRFTGNNVDVGAYAVGLSYGTKLSNKFMIGATVKFVGQKLGESYMPGSVWSDSTGSWTNENKKENKTSGLAFDFGTSFKTGFKSLSFGMSIRNFSQELKYEEESFQLPLTFIMGLSMNVMDFMEGMNPEEHSLVVAIDALHPRDYTERMHFGAEYWFMNMFSLRAGYKTNYDIEGLTAGLGFNYSVGDIGVKIDYAYSDIDIFDSVNRFAVGLSF